MNKECEAPPEREKQVTKQLSILDDVLCKAENISLELYSRLGCIMKDEPPVTEQKGKEDGPYFVEIAQLIYGAQVRLSQVVDRIYGMIDRLEI